MVLEELIDKLVKRLTAIERVLKEKGVLDEADIIPAAYPVILPLELGERIRAMNEPTTIGLMSVKGKDRTWLIHQLEDQLQAMEERITLLESKVK